MDHSSRQERLRGDRELLAALAADSTIFSFESSAAAPDRYALTFLGKGLARSASAHTDVAIVERHQIDLRMPFSYPDNPPDIRWLTPLWHPSVSFSGFVSLADVGLDWTPDTPIDAVCERLWDIARLAPLPLGRAVNYAAKHWLAHECKFDLPVDPRPLRDRPAAAGSNIVRYERRGAHGMRFVGPPVTGEVLFIDENTPAPPMPERRPYVPTSRRGNDEDVLYIGPE